MSKLYNLLQLFVGNKHHIDSKGAESTITFSEFAAKECRFCCVRAQNSTLSSIDFSASRHQTLQSFDGETEKVEKSRRRSTRLLEIDNNVSADHNCSRHKGQVGARLLQSKMHLA